MCGRSMAQIIVLKERDDDAFMCTGARGKEISGPIWCEKRMRWGRRLLIAIAAARNCRLFYHDINTYMHSHSFMQMTWKPFKSCHSNFPILFELTLEHLSAERQGNQGTLKTVFHFEVIGRIGERRSARWMWKVFIRFSPSLTLDP